MGLLIDSRGLSIYNGLFMEVSNKCYLCVSVRLCVRVPNPLEVISLRRKAILLLSPLSHILYST